MPPLDLVVKRFSRLLVIALHPERNCGHSMWVCKCDCGREFVCNGSPVQAGITKSCPTCASDSRTIHGHAKRSERSRTYRTWVSMRQRCTNPKSNHFDRYGGRGISCCSEWEDFEVFLKDMGSRPAWATLERIKNNEGYHSGNCRWATRKEQSNNTANNRWVHCDGKRMNLLDASKFTGKNWNSLYYALSANGMCVINRHVIVPEWFPGSNERRYKIDQRASF